ncbi:hypothetical protein BASA81_006355 [Batrachochytrium salamandrivorans]|nr:hypothetical protein BASA81_006355 [Batrachochytrium salamandrivorans]
MNDKLPDFFPSEAGDNSSLHSPVVNALAWLGPKLLICGTGLSAVSAYKIAASPQKEDVDLAAVLVEDPAKQEENVKLEIINIVSRQSPSLKKLMSIDAKTPQSNNLTWHSLFSAVWDAALGWVLEGFSLPTLCLQSGTVRPVLRKLTSTLAHIRFAGSTFQGLLV